MAQKQALLIVMGTIDEAMRDQIGQISGVNEVVGTAVGVVQMSEIPYFQVMGEEPRGFAVGHYKLTAGQPLGCAHLRSIILSERRHGHE